MVRLQRRTHVCRPGAHECLLFSEEHGEYRRKWLRGSVQKLSLAACDRSYTWPGSSWRPSACEADVIATRPQVP